MQKQEFEERIERTVTDEQYKVIEEVYMWHPSIRNTSGKDEVAELYKSFGMTIFHDMLPRVKKSKTTTTKETYTSERWGKEGGTTIHQISFTVDISKIKDLPLLYKLIDELKDAQNRTDSPTPATT